MSTSLLELNQRRYPVGHLFGEWDAPQVDAQRVESPCKQYKSSRSNGSGKSQQQPQSQAQSPPVVKAPLRVSVHGGSQGRGDAEQMVTTVREVLLARLDDLGATALWPIAESAGLDHSTFLRMFQEMLWALFPVEIADGEEYAPDPACRMETPPAGVKLRKGGLFPHPCEGVGDERSLAFARHLLIGEQSPVATMTTADGEAMFSREELARLGERKRMRKESGRAELEEVEALEIV